jgi:hypothetical protein
MVPAVPPPRMTMRDIGRLLRFGTGVRSLAKMGHT